MRVVTPHEQGAGPNGTLDHFAAGDALIQRDGWRDPLEKDAQHVLAVKKGGRHHVENTQGQRERDKVLQKGFKPSRQETRQEPKARVQPTDTDGIDQPLRGFKKAEGLCDIQKCAGVGPIMHMKEGKITGLSREHGQVTIIVTLYATPFFRGNRGV